MSSRQLARVNFVAVWMALLWLNGCATISPYDEDTDKGVTALHGTAADLLAALDNSPVPDYPSTQPRYLGIQKELGTLRFRNDVRPKNDKTVKQLLELKAIFDKVEGFHKAGTLNQAMVGPIRDSLDQTFRAILKLELAKKELNER